MINRHFGKKHIRAIIVLAIAVSLTILVFSFQNTGTAQNSSPQIGLNSPVTFPGDI